MNSSGLNLSKLEKLERDLKTLTQQTKEPSTRNSGLLILDEIKALLNQVQVETWMKARIPELICNSRAQILSNQNSVTISDVTEALHSFYDQQRFYCSIGQSVISILNPCRSHLEKIATKSPNLDNQAMKNVAEQLLNQLFESETPQVAVMSGISGSGKSFNAVQLAREVLKLTENDDLVLSQKLDKLNFYFQAVTLMSTCATLQSKDSSKLGTFYEMQIQDKTVVQCKFHHVFLNQTRLVLSHGSDSNYHIFYAMLAGLSDEVLMSLSLPSRDANFYRYLSNNLIGSAGHSFDQYKERYHIWSQALRAMNINELDILKVLSAVILLGNLPLEAKNPSVLEDKVSSIANLLGVQEKSLLRSLTASDFSLKRGFMRSNGQSDVDRLLKSCDNLAQALYSRVLFALVKRGNSFNKCQDGPQNHFESGSISKASRSNFSTFMNFGSKSNYPNSHDKPEGSFQRTLSFQSAQLPLQNDGNFIGILDLFGSNYPTETNPVLNRLEQLCVNLCAETTEYFYKTHVFKNVIEFHREELREPITVDYCDNGPIVDLISSKKSGILSVFDRNSQDPNRPMTHALFSFQDSSGFEVGENGKSFLIEHFTDNVTYDIESLASDLEANVPHDTVFLFDPSQCSFPFASHLFSNELKLMNQQRHSTGFSFRLTHISRPEVIEGESLTFCQDFHYKLDSLLKVLVRSKPTFVRCIKPDQHSFSTGFNQSFVAEQCSQMKIPQSITITKYCLIHKMRHKTFVRMFEKVLQDDIASKVASVEEKTNFIVAAVEKSSPKVSANQMRCVIKRKHIFFSDGFLRQAELCCHMSSVSRNTTGFAPIAKNTAIVEPQYRKLKQDSGSKTNTFPHTIRTSTSSAEDKPPIPYQKNQTPEKKRKIIQLSDVLNAFGAHIRPQLPKNRQYSVIGNGARKLNFPHMRVMTDNYPSRGLSGEHVFGSSRSNDIFVGVEGVVLRRGDVVQALGSGEGVSRQGRIAVMKDGTTHHVPHSMCQPH